MTGVTRLDSGGQSIASPTWETVRNALLGVKDGGFVTLTVEDSTWMIVLFVEELGYMVGTTKGEVNYFNLIERSLGDEIVTVFDGGNMNEYPRYTFVSKQVVLKAAEFFFLNGDRDPGYERKSFRPVPVEGAGSSRPNCS